MKRALEAACCWEPPPRPQYLKPGDGHPETPQAVAGQAPYTAHRVAGGANYERDSRGILSTKTLAGEVDQFREGDVEQGLAYRQPL